MSPEQLEQAVQLRSALVKHAKASLHQFGVHDYESAAEDVVQEIYAELNSPGFPEPDGRASLKTWLTTRLNWRCLDYLRKEEYKEIPLSSFASTDDEADDVSGDEIVERHSAKDHPITDTASLEKQFDVRSALNKLPLVLRRILEMTFYAGLSEQQIASRLDMSQPTVSRRKKEALGLLRESLEDYAPSKPATAKPHAGPEAA
jgi:RNA polymerase sigma-70 factor (ECF subfamily)